MKVVKEEGAVITAVLQESDLIKPCPFCGSTPELVHTWTASYWLECECGAEFHDTGRAGKARDPKAHLASARRVVRKWNDQRITLTGR